MRTRVLWAAGRDRLKAVAIAMFNLAGFRRIRIQTGLGRAGLPVVLAMLLLAACGTPTNCRASGDQQGRILIGNVERTYLIHVPPYSPPQTGFPVVLGFHGAGGQARSFVWLTKLDAWADARGFIVVYPNGLGKRWNDGRATIKRKSDDIGFIAALLDEIEQRYSVNRARIYATGISNGAMFTQRLACELSDRIAAIAPVAGAMPADIAPLCRPMRAVSVLQISGSADPIVPFAGGAIAGGRGGGGEVLSAPRTAELWASLDGCAAASPGVALPPIAPPDGTAVMRKIYAPCRQGRTVTLLTIEGGGHTWPGGPQYLPAIFIGRASDQLDASRAIVEFFLGQPRQ
jgi:polyhydroxybutyrate depolymerase